MLLVGSLGLQPQAEIRRLSEMIEVGQRADLRLTVKAQLRSTMPQVEYRVGRPRGSKVFRRAKRSASFCGQRPHLVAVFIPENRLGQSIPWRLSKPSSD